MISPQLEEPACDACGEPGRRTRYAGSNRLQVEEGFAAPTTDHFGSSGSVVDCVRCGLARLYPRLRWEHSLEAYRGSEDPEYLAEFPGRLASARRVIRFLDEYRNGGRLLDVGCGAGVVLVAGRDRWQVQGVEVCSWAVREARQKFQLEVFEGDLEQAAFPDASFDAVTMLDVIEHVPHPKALVAEVFRILKPGGLFYVYTPDINSAAARLLGARWWGIRPAHIYYFSAHTLVAMLREQGFGIKWVRSPGRWFTFGYWVSKLAGYLPRFTKAALRVVRFLRLDGLPLYVNFFDSVGVLAVKNAEGPGPVR